MATRYVPGVRPLNRYWMRLYRDLREQYLDPIEQGFTDQLAKLAAMQQSHGFMTEHGVHIMAGLSGFQTQAVAHREVPVDLIQEHVRRLLQVTDQRMHANFKRAMGIDIRHLFTNAGIRELMESKIDEHVALLKTIPSRHQQRVLAELQKATLRDDPFRFNDDRPPFSEAILVDTVRSALTASNRYSEWNLKRIVRDQTNKNIGAFSEIRQRQIGVRSYKWSTSDDARVRPTHAIKDGQTFEWANPPPDTGHPGADILCRCIAMADTSTILSPELDYPLLAPEVEAPRHGGGATNTLSMSNQDIAEAQAPPRGADPNLVGSRDWAPHPKPSQAEIFWKKRVDTSTIPDRNRFLAPDRRMTRARKRDVATWRKTAREYFEEKVRREYREREYAIMVEEGTTHLVDNDPDKVPVSSSAIAAEMSEVNTRYGFAARSRSIEDVMTDLFNAVNDDYGGDLMADVRQAFAVNNSRVVTAMRSDVFINDIAGNDQLFKTGHELDTETHIGYPLEEEHGGERIKGIDVHLRGGNANAEAKMYMDYSTSHDTDDSTQFLRYIEAEYPDLLGDLDEHFSESVSAGDEWFDRLHRFYDMDIFQTQPKYGSIDSDQGHSHSFWWSPHINYGDLSVTLRNEEVRNRTGVVDDDSFTNNYGAGLLGGIDEGVLLKIVQRLGHGVDRARKGNRAKTLRHLAKFRETGDLRSLIGAGHVRFFEAHVFGRVGLDEIESVAATGLKSQQRIRDAIDQANAARVEATGRGVEIEVRSPVFDRRVAGITHGGVTHGNTRGSGMETYQQLLFPNADEIDRMDHYVAEAIAGKLYTITTDTNSGYDGFERLWEYNQPVARALFNAGRRRRMMRDGTIDDSSPAPSPGTETQDALKEFVRIAMNGHDFPDDDPLRQVYVQMFTGLPYIERAILTNRQYRGDNDGKSWWADVEPQHWTQHEAIDEHWAGDLRGHGWANAFSDH